jgi:hypothetical protein
VHQGIELIFTEALASGTNIKDATNCFHFQAQLLNSVPEHQKEAMLSWLSTATVEEIVDEFSHLGINFAWRCSSQLF